MGELTDDLSLLRIGYLEDNDRMDKRVENPETLRLLASAKKSISGGYPKAALKKLRRALSLSPDMHELKREMAEAYLEEKDYSRAARFSLDYARMRPEETEYLYLASYCLRKTGEHRQATEIGERVRAREPAMVKNLLNLASSYLHLENSGRARKILHCILKYEPGNKKAALLLKET